MCVCVFVCGCIYMLVVLDYLSGSREGGVTLMIMKF